ncbi:response regulator [Paracoccus suum]|uniref:Response regulator n=1 Tax=Paracoccus suum TaxID=2259340 RepID=A0A344PKT7_9RHOB|nr:response regulator [Paracoccus suum]AXC49992.1 response regulator [Paracoccus suum]
MSLPHILVVDDHREIRDAVTRYLERNGMRTSAARDAAEMDVRLAEARVDLVVLDLMMPGEDGLSACRRLAAAGGPPVLMLTALGDDTDRIVGLEIGADDYLPKPFNPRELLARIKAILRRAERPEPLAGGLTGSAVAFAGWVLDTDRQTLSREPDVADDGAANAEADSEAMRLTTAEFRLLTTLLERPRRVLSRETLLDAVSGRQPAAFDRSIDNLVSRLRRKIEADPANPAIISTVRAGGYCLTADVRRL